MLDFLEAIVHQCTIWRYLSVKLTLKWGCSSVTECIFDQHGFMSFFGGLFMQISLRYMYNKVLAIEPNAYIVDEHNGMLEIQWIGVTSPRFSSHKGILYFVSDESEMPAPPSADSDMYGCVVYRSLADEISSIPRIVVPDSCDMSKLFDHLVKEIDRYLTWHDRISDLLIADAPYQDMVNATAELVPRPMYVADASWRMISRVDFEMGEISATWHYQILHDGLYPHHIVDALNRTGDYYRISNLKHAALIDSEVYTLRILAKPLHHHGRLVGYYFMIDTWGDLGFCEVEIAEEFGNLIAPIMAARGAKEGHMAGFQDNFIIHILDGQMSSKLDIAQSLKTETQWMVESDFRLATVRFTPDEFENHLLHMRTMGMIMGNFDSHAYSYKDTALIIFHRAESERDDFLKHLQKCANDLKRTIVVSSRFSDFSRLKAYYEQNVHMHDLEEEPHANEPRVISCDRSFRYLLANCCKNALPSCYGADVLYAYDRAHNTNLCETLLVYILHERNAVATADALFVHRNTLRNRINKIDDIIGIDLNNNDERMHLLISLNSLVNATQ